MVPALIQDLRDAARSVRRDPRFHVPLVLLLAFPVAALALAGAAAHAFLFAPLRYERPSELVLVSNRFGHDGSQRSAASAPELLDYAARLPSLSQLAAVNSFSAALTDDGGPAEQLRVGVTSGGFLGMLGVKALHGRLYTAAEDTPLDTRDSANASVIVLGHELWRGRYGGDPAVVGRLLRVGGTPMRVIGILPAGFRLRLPPGGMSTDLDAWTPLRIDYAGAPREGRYLTLIGRLAPGRDLARLAVEAEVASRSLRRELSEYERAGLAIGVEPLHEAGVAHLRPILTLVATTAVLVLVLACLNAAGMLLVRLVERGGELAVRTTLGAAPARLLRHLAGEIAIVAASATALGVVLATVGVHLIRSAALHPELGELTLPPGIPVAIGALGLPVVIAGALALLGALPALHATRTLGGGMSRLAGAAALGRGWPRLRGGLIAAQVALSLLLVIGAGLLLRSSLALRSLPLGFEPRGVMTFRVALPFARYRDSRGWAQRYDELRRELAALPGVEAVGAADVLPASGGTATAPFAAVPSGGSEWGSTSAVYRTVSPGWFQAIGMPLLAGRSFTAQDGAEAPRVAVVDEAFARRVWGDAPLGRRLEIQVEDFSQGYRLARAEATVIGVVSTVAHDRPDRPSHGTIYVPLAQQAAWSVAFAVRTATEPASVMEPARRAIARLDPDLPAYDARAMPEIVRSTFALTDLALSVLASFALLALGVSAAGLFALIAYLVRSTRREQAIRMACGASPGRLVGALLRGALALAVVGLGAGVGLALPLVGYLERLLVGIRPADPLTLVVAAALVLGVSGISALAAAMRIVRLEPARMLRA